MAPNGETCWAVIFSSQRSRAQSGQYDATAQRMVELARQQPGFLEVESARSPDGFGITVCYWESPEAIAAWKGQAEHREAQERGKRDWYEGYRIRVARVEREYGHLAS